MKAPTIEQTKSAMAAIARSIGPWALAPIAYLLVFETFAMLAVGDGLLTPEAAVRWDLALLGAATLVLRLASLFVVPAVIAYRLLRPSDESS